MTEEAGKLAASALLLIFFLCFLHVVIRTEKNSLKIFKNLLYLGRVSGCIGTMGSWFSPSTM